MEKEWEIKKKSFVIVDVRELKGNFLPMVLKKGEKLPVGEGLCVIQSFEPIPIIQRPGRHGI